MTRPRPSLYRYATFDRLSDWLSLGWHFVGPASHHSAFVVWLCECPAREPMQ